MYSSKEGMLLQSHKRTLFQRQDLKHPTVSDLVEQADIIDIGVSSNTLALTHEGLSKG